jgi:FixJ family two-component response regulator
MKAAFTPVHPKIPSRNRDSVNGSVQRREVVYLLGNNVCCHETLSQHLAEFQVEVVGFRYARDYVEHIRTDGGSCLILDLPLPDMSGIDLQRQLAAAGHPPIIFVSESCDVPYSVQAMKAGALDFFTHPFDWPALIDSVQTALVQDRKLRQRRAELEKLRERLSRLTPREREVLPLVVGGLLNKQAASVLGISEVTLQIHRSQVMRKMQAESLADLVRMAIKLRIPYRRNGEMSSHTDTNVPFFTQQSGSRRETLSGMR